MQKNTIIFKDRLNYLWSFVREREKKKKIKRKKREKWPEAIEKIIGNVFFDAYWVLKESFIFCTQANFLRINIVIWNKHVNVDNLFSDRLPNQGQHFKVIETSAQWIK